MGCEHVVFCRVGCDAALAAGSQADRKENNLKTPQTCFLLTVSKILITNIQTLVLSGLIKLQLLIGSQKD